jgi:peptidoglycan-associated lipoprotein
MLRRSWTICSMAALLLAAPAVAQQPGTLILGGFGQYTLFDDNIGFDDAFGYGGRVGAFISPNAFLEAEGSYTAPDYVGPGPDRDAKYGPISARLMFAFPFTAMSGFNAGFQVGGGAVLSSYRTGNTGYNYNYGAEGAVGFTAAFGGFTALRLQALVDYMPTSEPDATMNFRFQAGLDFWPDPASQWMGMNPTASGPVVWWDDTPQPLPGTLELGGFVQYSFMDDNAGFNGGNRPDDGLGYGGRVGVFLTPNWEIEGDGQWSPLDNTFAANTAPIPVRRFETIDYSTFALRLNYNFPFAGFLGSNSSFLVGGGVVRTNYGAGDDVTPRPATYNYGASGIAGLRIGFAPRVALRIDGVVDYMPNSEPDASLNYAARAGLSLFLGGASRAAPEPPPAVCTWNSSILASDPNCRPPAPPVTPPVTPPPARCVYNNAILATDPNCVAPVVVDTSAITAPIYFDFDKSDIRPDAAATLDRKIPWLQANPGMRIRIEGNADNRGSDEYNLALGQRRAASARQYLADRGIDAGRFDLVSYGEERPVCSETPMTEACHQLNRRDDFRIVTVGGDGRIRTP